MLEWIIVAAIGTDTDLPVDIMRDNEYFIDCKIY